MADINLTAAEVAQLILSIGNAAALSTKDKTSLVAAINETLATAEAGGSPKAEKVSYSGNIDGTTVANVKAALDALTAREQALVVRFTKQSSGTITADKTIAAILAAHSSGKPVTGIYANGDYQLLEAQGSVAYFASWTGVDTFMLKGAASAGVDSWTLERLDIKGTNVALKGNIDGEDFTTVAGAIAILNRRGADHVAYSGTIGETTVANVKAALDALAVGKPLDMTADYVASGATSVEQWATMAKVVNGVASTTEYRVAPGRYYIGSEDMPNGWIVDIIAFWNTTFRAVIAIGGGPEPCPLFKATVTDTVGSSGFPQVGISIYGDDTGIVKWYGEDYYLVPISRKDDNGKFLKCIDFGYPMEWVDLPMATGAAAGVVKADAKTEDDTVPARIDADGKLWVKGQRKSNWREGNPADDAYVVNRPGGYYTNPMAAETITWDGNATGLEKVVLADLGEAKLCAYLVQSNFGIERAALIGGTITITAGTDEAIITISDKGYGVNLSGNECWCDERNGIIRLDDFDNDYVYIIFELNTAEFPSRGVWFTSLEDNNGNMLMYTSKLQTVAVGNIVKIPGKFLDLPIPDVTAADNNKFLRVVNGTPTWVALTNVAEEGA